MVGMVKGDEKPAAPFAALAPLLAIGLGVLYRRRTQPIAIGLFGVYVVIILAAAAVMSAFGRTN